MNVNPLGCTGIPVSELCFGTLVIGPLQANLSIQDGSELLAYSLDLGINFFDTAELYLTYPYFKPLSISQKQRMVINSKSYAYAYRDMMDSIENGLKAIDRDYFDIFMLHEQESLLTLKGHQDALRAMIKAKEQGKIRAIGISTHSVQLTKDLLLHPEIEVVFPLFNRVGQGLLHGTFEEMDQAIQNLYKNGFGIFTMKPLAGGRLYQSFLEELTYMRDYPHKHAIAVGTKNKNEILVDVAIFENRYEESMKGLLQLTEKRIFYRSELCIFCYTCITTCSSKVISKTENGKLSFDWDKCCCCGYCIASCPQFALRVL
ncbi:MAG: aldo/keto reductase [Caldisericia bacterium]|nr:aldo/keto reductase [Caldisericia bacterium]